MSDRSSESQLGSDSGENPLSASERDTLRKIIKAGGVTAGATVMSCADANKIIIDLVRKSHQESH